MIDGVNVSTQVNVALLKELFEFQKELMSQFINDSLDNKETQISTLNRGNIIDVRA
ncbi:hypothetical protein Dester_1028 [Desulfurobacterium thermolithotrophum DSM 11699]|uniref:Uncharacterized protein n=1 Tax=Desulfurobacterium thermolithotrophum (strain DSM 11699 / BSA) TaxID=868864 RepID=F0S494_DESTD|nr:hypothetical protein [Desulfurobacterium thermolithotrophum]ADY73666.1 hypothetical protein Dester_1028 [Desulfurobacterium thermolithotrophum DSM 11699]